MLTQWLKEIKEGQDPKKLGMILVHNGIVRATSKDGRKIKAMKLSYDKDRLSMLIKEFRHREGIADIRVWINEGELKVGDDIMWVFVAGRFRHEVFPTLEELVKCIKNEVVKEEEILL